MIIKNDKGEDIEVFTTEDVQAKITATAELERNKAIEEYKAANPDRSAELAEAQQKLKAAEEDLAAATAAGGGNPEQIARLRAERDDARLAAKKVTEEFEKKLTGFEQQRLDETKSDYLDRLSGGNADVRAKIEHAFNNYKPGLNSKKDIEERMQTAFKIVTDSRASPSLLNGVSNGAGGSSSINFPQSAATQFTQNEIAIGGNLGITDKDRQEYLAYKQKTQN